MTSEEIWSDLLDGNRRYAAGNPLARNLVREREALRESQHPKAVVLTCSDSRVAPEIIFDQPLGTMFVVRIAGNFADKLTIGSMEYAVELFSPPLLVVLGHQRCGGVQAACLGEKTTSPNLKALVKAIRSAWTEDCEFSGEDSLRQAERQNVSSVARALMERSDVLHRRVQKKEIAIVGAYYRLDSGTVEQLFWRDAALSFTRAIPA